MEELWGLTSFFVYSTQTFVQAVNLLDRFLTVMKVGNLECSLVSTYSANLCNDKLCMFNNASLEKNTRLTSFDFKSRDVNSHS